jgi:3-deoxy-D-manno-octulosonate 8-phosphate phosphatase (KDO 8-P phosphatase)
VAKAMLDERMQRVRMIVCDVDGVMTDGSRFVDGQGRPFRSFHVRDGVGLALWRNAGHLAALLSGLGSPAVDYIVKDWPLVEGLTSVHDKLGALKGLSKRHKVPMGEIAFLGDDLIDLNAMEAAGLAAAPADAVPLVREAAHLVLDTPGGRGAVRELVERLLQVQGLYHDAVAKYRDRTTGGH